MAKEKKFATFDDVLNGKAPDIREKYFSFCQSRNLPGGPVAYVVGAGNTTAHFSSFFRSGCPVFFLNPRSNLWLQKTPGNPLAIISGHHLELAKNVPGYDALTFATNPPPSGNGRVAGTFLNFLCGIMGKGTIILAGIDFDDCPQLCEKFIIDRENKMSNLYPDDNPNFVKYKDRTPDADGINFVIKKYEFDISFINLTWNHKIKLPNASIQDCVLKYLHFFNFGGTE